MLIPSTRVEKIENNNFKHVLKHKCDDFVFSIFSALVEGISMFDLKIEFCMPKSPLGSLPEVWRREICIKWADYYKAHRDAHENKQNIATGVWILIK